MEIPRNTFKKSERLTRKLLIEELFSKGKAFNVYPFRLLYLQKEVPSNYPVQLGISIPKKRIKKAVNRNRVKRYVREAYRKNKHDLYSALEDNKRQCALFIIYIGEGDIDYAKTEEKIIVLLQRLLQKVV